MNLTNKNFQHVLDTNEVVLVDFWADWCAPIVGKVNTTVENQLAARFGIRSLPTILIFKDGKIAEQLTGVRPKTQYADKLNYYLN